MDLSRLKQHKDEDWSRLSTKRCKQHKDQVRDWSGLPLGLVKTISDNLSLYDYLCFGKVCKSWRSYQEETLQRDNRRSRGFPWLVMHKEIEAQTLSCISLLEKNKLRQLELPTSSGGLIVGCIEDWLIIAKYVCKFTKVRMSLLNPFTRSEVVLPVKFNVEKKLMFSGDPGKQNCVYMLYDFLSFNVWIPEAKDWFQCCLDEDVSGEDYIMDSICFKGCFYLLTTQYNIRVLDAAYLYSTIQTQGYEKEIDTQFYEIKMSPDVPRDIIVRYLMEFGDEILLVVRYIRVPAGNEIVETYDFKVFRLDMCEKEWVKLDNLGDCVIFLGCNCSRCYSAKDLGGDDMGNCIYFTDGYIGPLDGLNLEVSCSTSIEKDDWGIFRLNSGGGSERFSYIAKLEKRPPFWITAPLWWYFN